MTTDIILYGILIGFLLLKGPKLLIEIVTLIGCTVIGLLIGLVSLGVLGTQWVRDCVRKLRGRRSGVMTPRETNSY